MSLDSVHFEVLYLFSPGESLKLNRDVVSACGGREKGKVVLQELERTGFVEQVYYGEFELTEKGERVIRDNSSEEKEEDDLPDQKLDKF